jgi:hypothetical protein
MYFISGVFPPGTIGIISHELSRYSDFCSSLVGLQAPSDTILIWNKGVEIAAGLNNIIRNMRGSWLWIMGDDHSFKADILLSLLSANRDIISPLCSGRTYPHFPVVFKGELEGGAYERYMWEEFPQNEIIEVVAAGNAGMLIKKHVLDAIGDPWFEAGKSNRENISEDLWFCKRARNAGYKINVHTGLGIGHITPSVIWPAWFDTKMIPMANFNGNEDFWVRLDAGYSREKAKPNIAETPSLI